MDNHRLQSQLETTQNVSDIKTRHTSNNKGWYSGKLEPITYYESLCGLCGLGKDRPFSFSWTFTTAKNNPFGRLRALKVNLYDFRREFFFFFLIINRRLKKYLKSNASDENITKINNIKKKNQYYLSRYIKYWRVNISYITYTFTLYPLYDISKQQLLVSLMDYFVKVLTV